jgi:Domain of unknown function (DUF4440)
MIRSRISSAIITTVCLVALSISPLIASPAPAPTSEAEKTVWELEHSYWRYVEANDLASYRKLWHADFLGWPSVSASPVHKDRITDWITTQTSAGRSFKLIAFKSAAIQSSDSTITACYWLTYKWIDKSGKGNERTVRVFHTWVKNGNDWQIISGMSMPETNAAPK